MAVGSRCRLTVLSSWPVSSSAGLRTFRFGCCRKLKSSYFTHFDRRFLFYSMNTRFARFRRAVPPHWFPSGIFSHGSLSALPAEIVPPQDRLGLAIHRPRGLPPGQPCLSPAMFLSQPVDRSSSRAGERGNSLPFRLACRPTILPSASSILIHPNRLRGPCRCYVALLSATSIYLHITRSHPHWHRQSSHQLPHYKFYPCALSIQHS